MKKRTSKRKPAPKKRVGLELVLGCDNISACAPCLTLINHSIPAPHRKSGVEEIVIKRTGGQQRWSDRDLRGYGESLAKVLGIPLTERNLAPEPHCCCCKCKS